MRDKSSHSQPQSHCPRSHWLPKPRQALEKHLPTPSICYIVDIDTPRTWQSDDTSDMAALWNLARRCGPSSAIRLLKNPSSRMLQTNPARAICLWRRVPKLRPSCRFARVWHSVGWTVYSPCLLRCFRALNSCVCPYACCMNRVPSSLGRRVLPGYYRTRWQSLPPSPCLGLELL